MGFFGIHDTPCRSLEVRGGYYYGTYSFLRLCAFLTFLTRAYVRPETPTHIPLQPLFIPNLIPKDSSSLSNVFILTTHSYIYIAFLITTSFSILYPGLCLLYNTILDPFSTYLVGLGLCHGVSISGDNI